MGNIKTYEGDRPYIFISYAHANSPAVMEVVEALAEQGYRIWYDDGIEVGSEWQEYIAGHLAGARLMVAFLSNAYMRSDNCRKEMHYALSKKIPTINIFLEQTEMTPGMEMQVGNLFALMKYCMPEEDFYDKLLNAPQLNPELTENGVQSYSNSMGNVYAAKGMEMEEADGAGTVVQSAKLIVSAYVSITFEAE